MSCVKQIFSKLSMIFRGATFDWSTEKENIRVKRGGWAELHPDLLDEIVKHISSYNDYVRFCAACKSWNTALPRISRHITRGPWLVLPFDDETFEIEKKESYHLRLPELQNTQLRGSCFGWLISVGIDGELRILNPFTSSYFLLPPLSTFPQVLSYQPDKHGQEYTLRHIGGDRSLYTFDSSRMQKTFVAKIVLSSSPEEEDFMALAIYGEYFKLAFYRAGDDKWTDVPTMDVKCGGYEDVIFHEGKIYAIDWQAYLYEFDMKTLSGGITEVPLPDNRFSFGCCDHKYLVRNPDGHLLLAVRLLDFYRKTNVRNGEIVKCRDTVRFDIFKLDESTKGWCREFGLGDYVLVVGYNSSIWKPPFADDEGNCVRNCIFYTDNVWEFLREGYYARNCINYIDKSREYGHDIGVFNLEDRKIKQLFQNSGTLCPPPVWV